MYMYIHIANEGGVYNIRNCTYTRTYAQLLTSYPSPQMAMLQFISSGLPTVSVHGVYSIILLCIIIIYVHTCSCVWWYMYMYIHCICYGVGCVQVRVPTTMHCDHLIEAQVGASADLKRAIVCQHMTPTFI